MATAYYFWMKYSPRVSLANSEARTGAAQSSAKQKRAKKTAKPPPFVYKGGTIRPFADVTTAPQDVAGTTFVILPTIAQQNKGQISFYTDDGKTDSPAHLWPNDTEAIKFQSTKQFQAWVQADEYAVLVATLL